MGAIAGMRHDSNGTVPIDCCVSTADRFVLKQTRGLWVGVRNECRLCFCFLSCLISITL